MGLSVIVVAMAATAACSDAHERPDVVRLDGSARFPDDEGIATSVDRRSITLDGARTYEVSDELRSFSTYTRELEAMVGRKGQYVQIGLDGRTMVWMAGVSRVIDVAGAPTVFYIGRFRRTSKGRFVFADGTTFAPSPGVAPPGTRSDVTVRIDPKTHRIIEITS